MLRYATVIQWDEIGDEVTNLPLTLDDSLSDEELLEEVCRLTHCLAWNLRGAMSTYNVKMLVLTSGRGHDATVQIVWGEPMREG